MQCSIKKNKRITVYFILLTVILLASACGKAERQRGIDGYAYEADKLPDRMTLGYNFRNDGNWLYYVGYGPALYRIPLGEDGRPENTVGRMVAGGEGILDYTVDTEGRVYCFKAAVSQGDSGGDGGVELERATLTRYAADGSADYSLLLDERKAAYPFLSTSPGFLAAGSDGQVYVLMGDTVLAVNGEGEITGEADVSAIRSEDQYYGVEMLLEGEGGRVYYMSVNDSENSRRIYELSEDNGNYRFQALGMKGLEGMDVALGSFYGTRGGILYSGRNGILYRYSAADGIWKEMLRWSDSNLDKNANEVGWISEDTLIVSYQIYSNNNYEDDVYFLKKKRIEELPEREELILACWDSCSNELEQAVNRFNRNNSQYHITIQLYEWEEGLMRLDADLVSSDPPDLLDLTGLDVEKYIRKQGLEDLSAYVEKSSELKREDFLEQILDGYTFGGKLVGIPSGFILLTVVGRTQEVGEQAGWTLEDMMALTEKYPGRKLNGRSFHMNLDTYCREYIMNTFVDRAVGECNFDSEEFRSLVQWIADHSGKLMDLYGVVDVENQLIYEEHVASIREYLTNVSRAGNMTSMGYPSPDGSVRYRANAYNALGIPSGSGHKEGAWQFIEYFLSQDLDQILKASVGMFPSQKAFLEQLLEEAMTPQYWMTNGEIDLDKDGNPRKKIKWAVSYTDKEGEMVHEVYYDISKEEADALLEMISCTDFSLDNGTVTDVINIIAEETESYFSGDKSLEEVTKVIQNRVSTLVQESL